MSLMWKPVYKDWNKDISFLSKTKQCSPIYVAPMGNSEEK